MNRPLIPNDLAGTAIGSLNVIEMNFADRAAGEAQQQGRGIFGVDFEMAELVGNADGARDLAQQPTAVIDLVNRVEDDAAAKLSPCAVTPAVILRWMPVGQVLTDFHPGGDNT